MSDNVTTENILALKRKLKEAENEASDYEKQTNSKIKKRRKKLFQFH